MCEGFDILKTLQAYMNILQIKKYTADKETPTEIVHRRAIHIIKTNKQTNWTSVSQIKVYLWLPEVSFMKFSQKLGFPDFKIFHWKNKTFIF